MRGNVRQFSLGIDAEFDRVVNQGIVRLLKLIALELHEAIQDKTPVVTGAARASWHVSVGQPVYAVVGNTLAVLTLTEPDTVWITNAMAYISKLENGSSMQAPAGMVAVSLAEIEAKYKRAE